MAGSSSDYQRLIITGRPVLHNFVSEHDNGSRQSGKDCLGRDSRLKLREFRPTNTQKAPV